MNVLFITRPTVFSGPGGDTVQLEKTKEYLEKLGVSVEIADCSEPNLDGYDLIHFYNLRNPQDLLFNVRRAKKKGMPMVLSTIWGSYIECDRKERKGLQKWIANNISEYKVEYLKSIARILVNRNFHKGMLPYIFSGHYNAQREIAQTVNVLLPNSPTELERVKMDMKLPNAVGRSIANAVDLDVFDYESVTVGKYKSYEGCILSAARIEIRKCQLDLIRAVKGLPYQLVIVGKASPNSQEYYRKCQAEAGDNVTFVNHVTHAELAELYKVAKAHALISWMETPGLSTLEAAVMNCNVLVTDRGDTEYYFQEHAFYCEPGDVKSIRAGIENVMSKEYNNDLKQRVIDNFTWQHTAQQTLEGYQLAIKLHNIG
jgi:glycosyltransferase involved in cell wall biosynthesis